MANEAPPKLRTRRSKADGDQRTIYMTKTSPELDCARLATYEEMGYDVKEEPWRYKLTGSQAAFERRQKSYQEKGVAQAERVSKARDAEGLDTPREQTISTVTRVPMTADDLLREEIPGDDKPDNETSGLLP